MNKLSFATLLFVTVLIFFSACKDSTTLDDFQLEFGFDYYPLEIGKFREYLVDSIIYDINNGAVDTIQSSVYVREEIIDTITDNMGRIGFRIERYERTNQSQPWVVKDVWMSVLTEQQAESLEENLRFVKMVFPLKEDLVWDGNRFIDETTTISVAGESIEVFKSWEYEVTFIGEPAVVNNVVFDDVVEIVQANNENLIELRYSKEQYAKDVGLIHREMKILDTQCISLCDGLPWEEKAEKGFILRQILIDHN